MRTHAAAVTAVACLAAAAAAAPPPHVWIEGETPARTTFPFVAGGWGHADRLSGGKWLVAVVEPAQVAAKVPADGAEAGYDFVAPAAGRYDVWARVGYEFARAPLKWRVDDGAWADLPPEAFTTDLTPVADDTDVAWVRLGAVALSSGKHMIAFRVLARPIGDGGPQPFARLLFGLDAVCLSAGAFVPNGPHPPDARWQAPADRLAARHMTDLPAAGADAADRRTADLGGVWEAARFDEPGDVQDRTGPIAALPTDLAALPWRAVRVPADKNAGRPEWAGCHRLLLRTRVAVPADLAGRAFLLRFPNNALLTTVFVNGSRVGFSAVPNAPFECDATAAVRPGRVNEVVVGIKDHYYGVAGTAPGRSCRWLFHVPPDGFQTLGSLAWTFDSPPPAPHRRSGILETPSVTAAGRVSVADVFCRPSVTKRQLGLDITLRNSTAAAVGVEVRNAVRPLPADGPPADGPPAKTLPAVTATVPANGSETVTVADGWADAALWWPDDPRRYVVETTVLINGVAVDRYETKFGFREWGRAGGRLTLNTVPWSLRGDLWGGGPDGGQTPEATVAAWRRHGQTVFHYAGEAPWVGGGQRETLDFCDVAGVVVRRGVTPVGPPAGRGSPTAAYFDNRRRQVQAQVRAERNHPSVALWSLEDVAGGETEAKRATEALAGADPTRPAVAALRAVAADVPATLPTDKPLLLDLDLPSGPLPVVLAAIIGAPVFADPGPDRLARSVSEELRWRGVAGFQLRTAGGPGAGYYRAWQPVCVLCRERDTAFVAGSTVTRTLKVFNDTRSADPITVHWLFQTTGGSAVAQVRGRRTVTVPPGGAEEFAVPLAMPAAAGGQADGELILTCERNRKEVFRDVTPARLVAPPAKSD